MSQTSPLVRLLAALFTLALVAAACGDDDDASTESTTTTAVADETTTSTTSSSTTTTAGDDDDGDGDGDGDGATDPPGDVGGENEGLGDPLVFVGTLRGDTEVPGPGDPGGAGRVEIESDVDGNLCFDMVATGLDADVTASHIHEAPAGAAGDVVIDIGLPTSSEGDTDTWTDVCVAVADDVIERMNADPAGFYANVHTATFGSGAVRGQLEQATIFDLQLS